MENTVYVVTEITVKDNSHVIIGVATDLKAVRAMIETYYGGKLRKLWEDDVRDSGIEFMLDGKIDDVHVKIIVSYHTLNSID